ncbi:MAG: toxin-antitoxin system YwqK family antitoxin [Fusobacteriaceae bacterium]
MKKILILFLIVFSASFGEIEASIKEFTSYYDNGQLEAKGKYIDGKKVGFWYIFDEKGILREEITYINEEALFGIKTFNEKGLISSGGTIREGFQDGKWSFYDEQGKLLIVMEFKNGLRDGVFIAYSEKGVPIVVGIFEKNALKEIQSLK